MLSILGINTWNNNLNVLQLYLRRIYLVNNPNKSAMTTVTVQYSLYVTYTHWQQYMKEQTKCFKVVPVADVSSE